MATGDRYVEWLESLGFREEVFRLSWVEYDLVAYQVVKEYGTKAGVRTVKEKL